jgi:3-deoxy-7-phosphoheptulonate synthase
VGKKRRAEDAPGVGASDSGTNNRRVTKLRPLLPPACLLEEKPLTAAAEATVRTSRQDVEAILAGRDDRLVAIVGPCSVHDVDSAVTYAKALKEMADEFSNEILVVMRVYFEKPRTTVGWKGLINDPKLNGSFNINLGLRLARQLLLDINGMGLPAGCEFLDSISPQYTADLVCWGAIGARTTESQIHRELASGLSCPIGFKNGTGGNMQIAVDAIRSASNPHSFLGVTEQGLAAIVTTTGNKHCHVILRGGSDGPNYSAEHVSKASGLLQKHALATSVMVDCSHGNSKKIHTNQPLVAADIASQIASGSKGVCGVMIESNINEGNQKLSPGTTDVASLKYGVSVTDACIDLSTTRQVLQNLADAVKQRRGN